MSEYDDDGINDAADEPEIVEGESGADERDGPGPGDVEGSEDRDTDETDQSDGPKEVIYSAALPTSLISRKECSEKERAIWDTYLKLINFRPGRSTPRASVANFSQAKAARFDAEDE